MTHAFILSKTMISIPFEEIKLTKIYANKCAISYYNVVRFCHHLHLPRPVVVAAVLLPAAE